MEELNSNISFNDNFSHWLAYGMALKISEDIIIEYMKGRKHSLDLNNLLIAACFISTDKIIKTLVELGADIKAKSKIDSTPIMFIAQRDNLPMFKYFMEGGANMYEKNSRNLDVEYYARIAPKTEVLNYIRMVQKQSSNIIETLKSENKELEDKVNRLRQYTAQLVTNINVKLGKRSRIEL